VAVPPTKRPAGDPPGDDVRVTLYERRLAGPVVVRLAFERNSPELEQLRVGAFIEAKGQRWRIRDALIGGASGFVVVERAT
jgi:hypothetical protein